MCCLLCGSNETTYFQDIQSFGIPLVYHQCNRCGLIFQAPGENSASDPEFYAEMYRKVYQESVVPTEKDLWVQKQRALVLLETIQTLVIGEPERHLDIGASTGILLQVFNNAFGCDSVGIEPGNAYRAYAEQQGLKLYPTLESLFDNDFQRFDFISMIHVLEHLPRPLETLTAIRKKLIQDDSLLILEVPNFYFHDSFELAHQVCFTPHTLRELVKQAGFQVLYINTHGLPRSSLLNLYITLLARPMLDDDRIRRIKSDRFSRQRRQLGFLYRKLIQKLAPHQAWLSLPE